MDYQKKKLLSQSIGFFQANMTLTSDFLRSLVSYDILTEEEVSTVQKDETSSGKILEMVCLLKRKDNRTYSKFIEVLNIHKFVAVASLLKSKSVDSDKVKADPRTVQFLERFLGETIVNHQRLNDLALNIVMKQVHKDEVSALQDKVNALQLQRITKVKPPLRRTPTSCDIQENSEGNGRPPTSSSSASGQSRGSDKDTSVWDFSTQKEEIESLLRHKDGIIKRNDTEYRKLKVLLDDTQNHLDSVLDINNQYLLIISQFNAMQRTGATPRAGEKDREIADLESQLVDANQKIEELNDELDKVSGQLTSEQVEVDRLRKREKRYKDLLGLDAKANEQDVERQIERLMHEGNMSKTELEKAQRELSKITAQKALIDDRMTTLTREKEKIEFHLRQQELMIKKMKRMKVASHTIQAAEGLLANQDGAAAGIQVRLPSIARPPSSIGLAAVKNSRIGRQYCVLCRTEYEPLKPSQCRVHFRAMRDGRWTCCRDDCHRGVGCLQVPHFYIELTVDKKVFLTDGGRYWEM